MGCPNETNLGSAGRRAMKEARHARGDDAVIIAERLPDNSDLTARLASEHRTGETGRLVAQPRRTLVKG
jgi:hypothetical protein